MGSSREIQKNLSGSSSSSESNEDSSTLLRQRMREGRLCVRYSGSVYDVTDFAERHPGGREWLRKFCGQDVTEVMRGEGAAPHRHTNGAYSILKKYQVAKEDTAETTTQEKRAENGYSNAAFHSTKDDALVDWSRPVLAQVWGLGDHYYRWVHEPVDFGLRLFQSDLLEALSKCPWYMVPAFWVPVALLLLMRSRATLAAAAAASASEEAEPVVWKLVVTEVTVTPGCLPLLVFLGVVLWTFCEYTLHRWLFHMKPPSCLPPLVLLHFVLHGQHHKAPMDRTRLVFPTIPASILGGLIYGLYGLLSPWAVAQALFCGTVLGYMAYDLTHYYIHHGSPALAYFADLKRYHVKHHFEHQQLGFGISSKLWDYPFGTLIPDSN